MSRRSRIFHERAPRRAGSSATGRRRVRKAKQHPLRFRQRHNVSVASMVASPEELTGRPILRMNIVGLVVLVLFIVLILRLWALQIIDHSSYSAAVSANEVRTASVPAPRGLITARNGAVLAGNQVEYQIVLSRLEASQEPSIVGQLAALVGEKPSQVQAALANPQYSPYEPVPILTGAPMATVQYLSEHQTEFPGVSVEQVTERTYPHGGSTAAQVLGYVSAINATELKEHTTGRYTQATQYGQSGLENAYQQYLAGTPGAKRLLVNAQGQVVGTLHNTPPVQGDTVVTNIDLGLQTAVQKALAADIATDRHTVDQTTGKYPTPDTAAAIVMNVQTGAVLAMTSYPTYTLKVWLGGISEANYSALEADGSLNNNATQGLYTPGSSFKLASGVAALQTGLITSGTPFDDPGTYKIPSCTSGCTFHDDSPSDATTHLTIASAITESDDDFFYNIGYQFFARSAIYGPTPIQNTAHSLGFGEQTGIDLPDEVKGQIDSPTLRKQQHQATPKAYPYATWFAGDSLELAFGQGETVVTPIEEAQAYATFANGGTRYAPEVAAAIVKPDGQVVTRIAPKKLGTVSLPPSVMQPMLQGFEGVVATKKGTAYGTFQQYAHFKLTTFRIAGKTGTADISALGTKEPDAWFIGFGPEPNPEYVVVVSIGEGGYGAQAAAPAVINIFNYLVAHPVPPVTMPRPPVTRSVAPARGASTTATSVPAATTSTPPAAAAG
jgi:penicillin-binding protein 2